MRMQGVLKKSSRVFIAGCLLLACCAGCSQIKQIFPGSGKEASAQIERSYRQGRYQHSLEQSEVLLTQHPGSAFYDRALYYAGLSLVQLGPSAENSFRALQYFQKLLRECPDSALTGESAAWVNILSRSAQAQKELQEKGVLISQCRSSSDEKDRQIVRLKAEIERLKKKLELLKKVDLQFQQQKKDMHNAGNQ